MKKLIDERVRDEGKRGRIAPHHLLLKVEWGTHSEAPPEILHDLKNEVLAAAIDHINDHRYRTLGAVTVEAEVDIFTTGISVDPTFGEFEEDLRRQDEEKRVAKSGVPIPDRKSTRLNSSHSQISYAVFCLKKKNKNQTLATSQDDDKNQSVRLH